MRTPLTIKRNSMLSVLICMGMVCSLTANVDAREFGTDVINLQDAKDYRKASLNLERKVQQDRKKTKDAKINPKRRCELNQAAAFAEFGRNVNRIHQMSGPIQDGGAFLSPIQREIDVSKGNLQQFNAEKDGINRNINELNFELRRLTENKAIKKAEIDIAKAKKNVEKLNKQLANEQKKLANEENKKRPRQDKIDDIQANIRSLLDVELPAAAEAVKNAENQLVVVTDVKLNLKRQNEIAQEFIVLEKDLDAVKLLITDESKTLKLGQQLKGNILEGLNPLLKLNENLSGRNLIFTAGACT